MKGENTLDSEAEPMVINAETMRAAIKAFKQNGNNGAHEDIKVSDKLGFI